MTKEFEARLKTDCVVDTKVYRYVYELFHNQSVQYWQIRRLPISKLSTMAAYTDWEVIKVFK